MSNLPSSSPPLFENFPLSASRRNSSALQIGILAEELKAMQAGFSPSASGPPSPRTRVQRSGSPAPVSSRFVPSGSSGSATPRVEEGLEASENAEIPRSNSEKRLSGTWKASSRSPNSQLSSSSRRDSSQSDDLIVSRSIPFSPAFLAVLARLPPLPAGRPLSATSFDGASAEDLMENPFSPGTAVCPCSRAHLSLDFDSAFLYNFQSKLKTMEEIRREIDNSSATLVAPENFPASPAGHSHALQASSPASNGLLIASQDSAISSASTPNNGLSPSASFNNENISAPTLTSPLDSIDSSAAPQPDALQSPGSVQSPASPLSNSSEVPSLANSADSSLPANVGPASPIRSTFSSSPTFSAVAQAFSAENSPILLGILEAIEAAIAESENSRQHESNNAPLPFADPSHPLHSLFHSPNSCEPSASSASSSDNPFSAYFLPTPLLRCMDYIHCLLHHLLLIQKYLSDGEKLYYQRQFIEKENSEDFSSLASPIEENKENQTQRDSSASSSSPLSPPLSGRTLRLERFQRQFDEITEKCESIKEKESKIREKIDAAAMEVEKAKKTVLLGQNLSISSTKQAREIEKLAKNRQIRAETMEELEKIVKERSILQTQSQQLAILLKQLSLPPESRDYRMIYREILQNPIFSQLYSKEELSFIQGKIHYFARSRRAGKESQEKLGKIQEILHELRERFDEWIGRKWR